MRAARVEIAGPLDIALVGIPLDLGATYRSGSRHGPAGVREASRLIRQVNPTTKVNPYRLCNVGDVGDAPTHPLSVERSVELIQAFYERIDAIGATPISVGGDHTVPLPFCEPSPGNVPLRLFRSISTRTLSTSSWGRNATTRPSSGGRSRRGWSIPGGSFRSDCAGQGMAMMTSIMERASASA